MKQSNNRLDARQCSRVTATVALRVAGKVGEAGGSQTQNVPIPGRTQLRQQHPFLLVCIHAPSRSSSFLRRRSRCSRFGLGGEWASSRLPSLPFSDHHRQGKPMRGKFTSTISPLGWTKRVDPDLACAEPLSVH